jgi:hypothetical protein
MVSEEEEEEDKDAPGRIPRCHHPQPQEEPSPKKPKLADLHVQHVAPYSFLKEAVESGGDEGYFEGSRFGILKEAFVRRDYRGIFRLIEKKWLDSTAEGKPTTLVIIRGSSGVGKSVFLAYLLARYRKGGLKDLALFHAPKFLKSGSGYVNPDNVKCSVWLDEKNKITGHYRNVENKIEAMLSKVEMVIMDGCSMPIDFVMNHFKGLIVVSASPSLYVKNLLDGIGNHFSFTMPPLPNDEALEMANILEIDEALVQENFSHMTGITRYLFEKDAAKRKVIEAITSVNATTIARMVSMQSSSKHDEQVTVHSLVIWKVNNQNYEENPTFALVSRYAEQLVAKKLAKETAVNLRATRNSLLPISGAEGYAGALFEAYAIRMLQNGGQFTLRQLEGAATESVVVTFKRMTTDPIETESNNLTTAAVNYDEMRVVDGNPRLLWPTTTNFPTFDCFYLHIDGTVYALQMTVSKTHPLKNSGAKRAKDFLDKMFGKANKPQKYKAVFVVPEDLAADYLAQNFVGPVDTENIDMSGSFEQWVMGLP